ncbi:unnamed protein product [Ambrosiozyma monospora]|uniref:Unnamed protein product n=1 Tax=Ambrosiozyma monospora TaxID=43982 RepID=A0ACB5T8C1_AMBMO|nr:unnamed protein product [Ambrosiozyma monospora]
MSNNQIKDDPFSDEHAYQAQPDPNITKLQKSLEETTGLMRDNIRKKEETGELLDENVQLTENLKLTATSFRDQSKKVKNQMWKKNLKLKLCLFLVILIILAAIIIPIVIHFSK